MISKFLWRSNVKLWDVFILLEQILFINPKDKFNSEENTCVTFILYF